MTVRATIIAIVLFDVLVSPGWLYTIVVGAALAFAVNQIKIDWSALW